MGSKLNRMDTYTICNSQSRNYFGRSFDCFVNHNIKMMNHIGGVMVSVLSLCAVDCGFEPRVGQTKDCKISICCFFAKHAALRRKSKELGIRIMCLNGATCLSTDCCFSELALKKID